MIDIKDITEEYLRSLPNISRRAMEAKEEEDHVMREKIRAGKVSEEDVRLPSRKEAATTLLESVLPKSSLLQEALAREKEPVLNQASWKDFSLLAGNPKSPGNSVLNRVKRTCTHAGACVMATEIVNPKTHKEILVRQQQILHCLSKNPRTRKCLAGEMRGIAKGERVRLSLWQKRSDINSPIFQENIGRFYFRQFGLGFGNRSWIFLQANKIVADWHRHIALTVFLLILAPYICYYAYLGKTLSTQPVRIAIHLNPLCFRYHTPPYLGLFATLLHHLKLTFVPFLYFFQKSHIFSEIKIGDKIGLFDLHMAGLLNLETTIFIFSLEFIKLGSWWLLISHVRKRRATINFLAFHLAAFQDLLHHAHRICRLVAHNPALKVLYASRLAKTWALLQTKNGDLGHLVHNLRTKNFRNRWYFFDIDSTGQLLVTYKLLESHKDAFADLIYEMGMIDVQLGIVKLMAEHQKGRVSNPITLGTFKDASNNRPELHATGAWHCFLDAADAVPNDAMMDFDRAFIIITGPNAGGKSTYILSIGFNAILNQSFSIAYAQKFVQTIFYKIISYVNVIQDLSKGLSLAEAGMEVLRAHKNILSQMTQPVLAIVDEILNGVDPKVAKEYSYKILKKRSSTHPNCLTLVTTHLMNLTELAKEDKRFHNKKVVVQIPGLNGRPFNYTYQICDGIADQNVVEMMLAEKEVI